MQGARPNVGKVSVPLGGKQSTKLSGAGTPQAQPYKPNQWGAVSPPGTGYGDVPAPTATRHQPAGAPRRTGSAEIANVGGRGVVQAGTVTGTPAEPVQQVASVLNNAGSTS
jgi:hypothetical protein